MLYYIGNKTQFYYLYPILKHESGQVVIEAALSDFSMWVWVVKLSFYYQSSWEKIIYQFLIFKYFKNNNVKKRLSLIMFCDII